MKIKTKKPFIPESWEIVEDKGIKEVDTNDLILHLEPEQEKNYIIGTKLRKRLKDKPVLSASVLDYLLEHQELIPEEWKGECVFFWGTIYRPLLNDSLFVRYLTWSGVSWFWIYSWLGFDFDDRHPAILSRKSLDTLPLELNINGTIYIKK